MKKYILGLFLCFATVLCVAFKPLPICTGCKSIHVQNQNGLYVIHIPYAGEYKVKPYVVEKLIENQKVFEKTKAKLVVNAGYFDMKNQGTTSYVIVDKKIELDPKTNPNLIENEELKPYMKEILNRTEFRILDCKGQTRYDISAHKSRVPYRCSLVHSVQAGPLLYPNLRLEQEAFLIKKNGVVVKDSITSTTKRPRTAIGIKNNDLFLIVATKQNPLTINELVDVCRELNLDRAMNLDGGGSTSLDFNVFDKKLHIVSEKNNSARKLKSFLVVE